MALQGQELIDFRTKYGIPEAGYKVQNGGSVRATTTGNPADDFRAEVAKRRADRAAATEASALKRETTASNPIQGLANDAFGTLIAKPAIRLSQGIASGAGALIGGDIGNRLQEESNKDMAVPSPFGGKILVEGQKAFGEGGARQIASDVAKDASYLAPVGKAGAIGAKVAGGKILGGAAEGAIAGGLSGGAAGLGEGLADPNKGVVDVAKDTAIGAGIGAAAGGVLGGVAGAVGKAVQPRTPEQSLKYITPTSREIPEEEFKNLVNQGRIAPKTLTKPAQYILSPNEREVALKYSHVIDKEPVNTSINIGKQIGELDGQVGDFLEQNNGIFNRGELRNHLDDALADIDDITISKDRIQEAKDNLIARFVDSIKKGDMKGLWEARKEFDQQIDDAFRGSPSLKKEIKVKLRNAVQDFIADRTPDGQYRDFMHDMSNLFDLRDVADVKAAKGRGLDALRQWAKDNPKTAKILGFTASGLGLGALGLGAANVVNAGSGE